eukprot:4156491-Amphidinium_carterae.1
MPAGDTRIQCAYKRCRSNQECKNASYTLRAEEVDRLCCRPLRSHCRIVRFCCESHKKKCKVRQQVKRNREGAEALNAAQVAKVFSVLAFQCGAPWAAVLVVMQMIMGAERADCARSTRLSWLSGLDPASPENPSIQIPKINGKTTPRIEPIQDDFARMLWGWMTTQPLKGSANTQWPFRGQPLFPTQPTSIADPVLFPGAKAGGQNTRLWE